LAECAAAGTPCVLATVVACEPPASARPGDKAVITADGRLRGWIGGSCSEPLVRREALKALTEGTPRLVRIVADTAAAAAGATGVGHHPGELTLATSCPSGGTLEIFIEPRLPKPLLIVFGASPAAHTLVALGSLTGFRTCAVHPAARPEHFAGADLVLSGLDLAAAAPGLDTWVVVATMGHYDEDALEAALAYPGVDVALVASGRRAAAVLQALRRRGLHDAVLARVRTPAGGTHARTQEEIALAALAEVVALRRRGGSRPEVTAPEAVFATDPVCGMPVEVAAARYRLDRNGETLYFCSEDCREQFG